MSFCSRVKSSISYQLLGYIASLALIERLEQALLLLTFSVQNKKR